MAKKALGEADNPSNEELEGERAPAAEFESPEDIERKIAEAAYYKAERRGFEPGHEIEDWLAAEAEIRGRRTSDDAALA
ncbi:DUF2934 domain-containing protein [Candidatus Methylocalor cossyra]|uniref:DUF2934 domain-containing protein n=1 Tax=Candidatus Methylocalor cossyra TaxID=3108543 RepID=A0ABM9NHZ2_9GAMM